MKSWNDTSPANLKPAWNIENLDMLIMKIAKGINVEEA